eukprot:Skav210333  [mRNA]  locus=scaffold4443:11652:12171:- [translate_table: standard]
MSWPMEQYESLRQRACPEPLKPQEQIAAKVGVLAGNCNKVQAKVASSKSSWPGTTSARNKGSCNRVRLGEQ